MRIRFALARLLDLGYTCWRMTEWSRNSAKTVGLSC